MPEKGWIKLHRKILDCWIWQDKPYDKARAWVDLLLLAMHHDKKILIDEKIVVISRGSFLTSIVKLSDRWGWSRNKVSRYLQLLENEQMLNTKRTPKGTLVTIVKYENYQVFDLEDESTHGATYGTSVGTAHETPSEAADESQNKNIKNYKNEKNNIIAISQDVKRTLDAWNELCSCGIKPVERLKSGTQRYQMLQARISEYGIDDVLKAIKKIKNSNFLQGKHNGKPWQITFDWFVRPNNFPKVLEGNYDNGGDKNGRIRSNDTPDEADPYADKFFGGFE